jgi:hypothetical protein
MVNMKSILNAIYEFFVEMGKAKAATALARAGDYESAKHIMTKK